MSKRIPCSRLRMIVDLSACALSFGIVCLCPVATSAAEVLSAWSGLPTMTPINAGTESAARLPPYSSEHSLELAQALPLSSRPKQSMATISTPRAAASPRAGIAAVATRTPRPTPRPSPSPGVTPIPRPTPQPSPSAGATPAPRPTPRPSPSLGATPSPRPTPPVVSPSF